MTLQLHNTLTKQIDAFQPQNPNRVTLYTCGPTVYNYLHVGNWAAYIYWDTLVRTLITDGYTVERVMNITDVGHLTSDEDEGEDKLQKGARREGKTAWEVAAFYGDDFLRGMKRLNLLSPQHIIKATEYIDEQLALIRTLKEKGYTYQISDGIYFDTAKFPTYADFAGLDLAAQQAGARVEYNPEKRNPSDFALWKFSPKDEQRDMEWDTPVDLLEEGVRTAQADDRQGDDENRTEPYTKYGEGESQSATQHGAASTISASGSAARQDGAMSESVAGFPGWHIECSAMAMSILGNTLDIHTGGIDHIPVHHTNEIAQSESASGVRFSNYWLHNNHLKANGTKISKSLGNGYTLDDLEARGFLPMDYRLFVLQSHYRSEGNFTFDNLTAAKQRLAHWRSMAALRHQVYESPDIGAAGDALKVAAKAVLNALNDDLNTPEALLNIDEAFNSLPLDSIDFIHREELLELLETIDQLLGLELLASTPDIPDDAKQCIVARERARESKDWAKSDELRDIITENYHIVLRDTASGTVWAYA